RTRAAASTALFARMMGTTMWEGLRADYMRTARAKGLMERQVILKHGLKNAMIPVVTLIGLDLATLIGSAVLTETVFNWPGMGSAVARAATGLDAPVVMGMTIVLVLAYVVVNLLVDLSHAFFEPASRHGAEHEALVRHDDPRPGRLLPRRVRGAHLAAGRDLLGAHRPRPRPHGRRPGRLLREGARRRADAHHRHLPRLPLHRRGHRAHPGARARPGSHPVPAQGRGHRHPRARAHRVDAVRPPVQ